jgi:hypothetical protein
VSNTCKAIGALIIASALGGCISHGPGGVAYSTESSPSVGATGSGAGGALSGSATPELQPEQKEQKEQRGNTPPGVDRDGHGPAAGAIVDPSGAATRGKPY